MKISIIVLLVVCLVFSSSFISGCNQKEDMPNDNESDESVKIMSTNAEEDVSDDLSSESNYDQTPIEIPSELDNNEIEEVDETTNEMQKKEDESDVMSVDEKIPVEDFTLSFSSVSVSVGERRMPIVTVTPQNADDKGEIWISSDTSVATVDSIGNITAVSVGTCKVTVTSTDNSNVSATVDVTVTPQPELTYIDGILVVNKTYPLPNTYAPGWETEASGPLWEMIAAAKAEGIELWMTSGYRSYYDQEYIYNGYVARDGQEEADTYSARPGYSEHQTGLAYDLNDLRSDFGETPEGKWVAENSYKYGFIVRYPKEKEAITGYIYEPWHVRYLGVEKAAEVYESGLCLEEFLGITSVYAE